MVCKSLYIEHVEYRSDEDPDVKLYINPVTIEWKTVNLPLQYGFETVEVHSDAIAPGQNVLIIDDLLATGGTVKATVELVEKLGGTVVEIAFIIELRPLNGRRKLEGHNIFTLIGYDEA